MRIPSGAGGGSAGMLTSTETLNITVDYATGVSPPADTTIISQDEFDALGAPLKYIQDVFKILPPFIAWPVRVLVLSGTQYADEDADPTASNILLLDASDAPYVAQNTFADISDYGYAPAKSLQARSGIEFRGQVTTLDSEIAGTIGAGPGAFFTRGSGTWTVGARKGNFAWVVSGASAGQVIPIIDNDGNTLTLAASPAALGACVVSVVEMATVLSATLADGTPVSSNFITGNMDQDRATCSFKDLSVGDSNNYLNIISSNSNFRNCLITQQSMVLVDQSKGTSKVGYCILDCNASDDSPLQALSGARVDLNNSVFFGDGKLLSLNSAQLGATDVYLEAGGAFTGALMEIKGKSAVTLGTSGIYIGGNNSCVGLGLTDSAANVFENPHGSFSISNCGTAISLSNSNLLLGGLVIGSTNGSAYAVAGGSDLRILSTSTLSGTYMHVDGEQFPFAEITDRGDVLVGRYASRISLI